MSVAAGRLPGALIAAVIVAIDQVIKALVTRMLPPGGSVPVLPGLLNLTHVQNSGIAFGLAGPVPLIVPAAIALTFLFLLFYNRPRWTRSLMARTALGLLAGGAAGNLIDRIRFGAVIDYLDVHVWPVFNVADVAVTAGAGLLIASLVLRPDPAQTRGEE